MLLAVAAAAIYYNHVSTPREYYYQEEEENQPEFETMALMGGVAQGRTQEPQGDAQGDPQGELQEKHAKTATRFKRSKFARQIMDPTPLPIPHRLDEWTANDEKYFKNAFYKGNMTQNKVVPTKSWLRIANAPYKSRMESLNPDPIPEDALYLDQRDNARQQQRDLIAAGISIEKNYNVPVEKERVGPNVDLTNKRFFKHLSGDRTIDAPPPIKGSATFRKAAPKWTEETIIKNIEYDIQDRQGPKGGLNRAPIREETIAELKPLGASSSTPIVESTKPRKGNPFLYKSGIHKPSEFEQPREQLQTHFPGSQIVYKPKTVTQHPLLPTREKANMSTDHRNPAFKIPHNVLNEQSKVGLKVEDAVEIKGIKTGAFQKPTKRVEIIPPHIGDDEETMNIRIKSAGVDAMPLKPTFQGKKEGGTMDITVNKINPAHRTSAAVEFSTVRTGQNREMVNPLLNEIHLIKKPKFSEIKTIEYHDGENLFTPRIGQLVVATKPKIAGLASFDVNFEKEIDLPIQSIRPRFQVGKIPTPRQKINEVVVADANEEVTREPVKSKAIVSKKKLRIKKLEKNSDINILNN
jgi:hypothetical protein